MRGRVRVYSRIVVKVGTSTLTHENGKLNLQAIERLVRVLSDLKNAGKEIILVTSGAIGVGVGKLGLDKKPEDIPSKQAAAAIGQCELMFIYDKFFSEYGHTIAQVLLNRDATEDAIRKQNIINTVECLLRMDAVPVVNENDTVSTEEIEFGDNDSLSAVVAVLANADLLIMLTDIPGLCDCDPRENPHAKLIERVEHIDDQIRALAGGRGSSRGTGGMITKINAAELATANGIDTVITDGAQPKHLYKVLEGRPIGTLFVKRS